MSAVNRPEIIYYPNVSEGLRDKPFDLSDGDYSWSQQLRILADKNGIEIHTPDRASFKNVQGVLFFDNMFYRNVDALTDLRAKKLLSKTIYMDYEPPTGHAKKHEPESIRELSKMFKTVVTYDDSLAGTANFIKGNVANFHSSSPTRFRQFNDKKMICMVTSNTDNDFIIRVLNEYNYTNHFNNKNIKYHKKAIYHKRIQMADYYLENHPEDFDLFGLFWPERLNKVSRGFLEKNKKIQKLSEYKFAITLDSYTDQNGYISEKIFDAFFAGTVPVYLGANNVTDYIPKQCFIDIRDFNSNDELYEYLSTMSESEYSKRQRAIEKFLSSKEFHNYFSSAGIARTLLDAIQAPARQDYSQEEAGDILTQLIEERDKIRKQIGVIGVDKVEIGKKWNFLLYVTTGRHNVDSIVNGVYMRTVDGLTRLKARPAHYCDNEKFDTLNITLPYEDIVSKKKIELFLKEQDEYIKIPFFTKEAIEGTHYDDTTRFFVKNNVIYIPGKIHKKLRRIYSKYDG